MNFPPQTKTYTSYHIMLLGHIFKRRNYYLTPYYRPTKVRPLTSQSTVRWNIAKTPILTWVYFCDFNWLVVIMVVCPLFKLILMCLLLSTCNTCCEMHDFNLIMYLIFFLIWFDLILKDVQNTLTAYFQEVYIRSWPCHLFCYYCKLAISLFISSPYMNRR